MRGTADLGLGRGALQAEQACQELMLKVQRAGLDWPVSPGAEVFPQCMSATGSGRRECRSVKLPWPRAWISQLQGAVSFQPQRLWASGLLAERSLCSSLGCNPDSLVCPAWFTGPQQVWDQEVPLQPQALAGRCGVSEVSHQGQLRGRPELPSLSAKLSSEQFSP